MGVHDRQRRAGLLLRRRDLGAVVHQRGHRGHHDRHERGRDRDHDPDDPAPDREPGGGRGRVVGLDRLGVARHPRGVGEAAEHPDPDEHPGEGVVAGRRVGRQQGEHQGEDGRADAADHHERLAHLEPVREQPGDDQTDDVGRPVPVGEGVGPLLAVAEDGGEVDDEVADGGEVEQQEHADGEGRADDVQPHHLPPAALQRLLRVQALGPGLDQCPVAQADHDLVADPRRQLAQAQQRDHEDDQGGRAGVAQLVLPVGGVQRAAGDRGDHQAADDRAHGPVAHGRRPAQLRGEVPDQGGGGDQDDALDEADHGEEQQVGGLVRGVRQAEQHQQADHQQPVHHQVGPAPAVGEPGDQRGEGADGVADDRYPDEVAVAHPVVGDDRRGHRVLDVQGVVQHDRGQHHDGQVGVAASTVGVGVQIAPEQPVERAARGHGSGWSVVGGERRAAHAAPHGTGSGGRAQSGPGSASGGEGVKGGYDRPVGTD